MTLPTLPDANKLPNFEISLVTQEVEITFRNVGSQPTLGTIGFMVGCVMNKPNKTENVWGIAAVWNRVAVSFCSKVIYPFGLEPAVLNSGSRHHSRPSTMLWVLTINDDDITPHGFTNTPIMSKRHMYTAEMQEFFRATPGLFQFYFRSRDIRLRNGGQLG